MAMRWNIPPPLPFRVIGGYLLEYPPAPPFRVKQVYFLDYIFPVYVGIYHPLPFHRICLNMTICWYIPPFPHSSTRLFIGICPPLLLNRIGLNKTIYWYISHLLLNKIGLNKTIYWYISHPHPPPSPQNRAKQDYLLVYIL